MRSRPASDPTEAADDRSGADRRAQQRRASRRPLDPGFAAILVNQIAPPETDYVREYPDAPSVPRCGLVVNRRV